MTHAEFYRRALEIVDARHDDASACVEVHMWRYRSGDERVECRVWVDPAMIGPGYSVTGPTPETALAALETYPPDSTPETMGEIEIPRRSA